MNSTVPGIGVTRRFSDSDRRFTEFFAQFRIFIFQQRRGRFFDQFLVTPLHRAIAFTEMNDFTFVIAENLDFDMVRIFNEFFVCKHRNCQTLFPLPCALCDNLPPAEISLCAMRIPRPPPPAAALIITG